jgi:hypothetical protein
MEPKTLNDCSTAEYLQVFGTALNEEQIEFLNEWDRSMRIYLSSGFDAILWGDPRVGYHQFLFDDDGA